MRSNIAIVLLIFQVFPLLHAQEDFSPLIGFGGHYGLNYSNMHFKPTIQSRSLEMNSYGFIFYYISEKHLGIQLEANYTERGWESFSDSTKTNYNQFKMSYLEFPLLTNINVGGKHLRFIVNAGPYLAFNRESLKGADVGVPVIDTAGAINYRSQELFIAKLNSNFDYGYTLGIGFGFHSVAGDLTLRLRYTQGLTNIFPQFPEGCYKFSQMQTVYAGISYTYEFALKPKKR